MVQFMDFKKENRESESLIGDMDMDCCKLSMKTRLIGFGICFAIGLALTICSLIKLGSIVTDPTSFAVMYTLGNILGLMSTGFIKGPCSQLRSMFSLTRIVATLIFLAAMGMTLFSAIYLESFLLTLMFIIIQFLALIWYTLSYIPYARDCCISCFRKKISS